jgi:hypothetical protein
MIYGGHQFATINPGFMDILVKYHEAMISFKYFLPGISQIHIKRPRSLASDRLNSCG